MTVLKYFIGGVIIVGIIYFVVTQIKSLIRDIRERVKKKSSSEGDKEQGAVPAEVEEKEVHK